MESGKRGQDQFQQFEFASCVPFSDGVALADAANERQGVLFRAAAGVAPEPALIQRIEMLLSLNGPDTLRYTDQRLGQQRAVRLSTDSNGNTIVEGLLLCGESSSEAWLANLLRQRVPAQALGRQLLSGSATPPLKIAAASPQVCACLNVSMDQIRALLSDCSGNPTERLAVLQTTTGCGTNCGSCMPEVKRLVSLTPLGATAANVGR